MKHPRNSFFMSSKGNISCNGRSSNAVEGFRHYKAGGIKAEDEVLEYLRKQYPSAYRITGYAPGFDIAVPETKETVEVKQDKKSLYTGNFVVEIAFGGHRSGLSTTKADYWIFVDYEKMYVITPNELWRCIKDKGLQQKVFTSKGDDKSKIAYLVDKKLLIPYCKKIIEKENL